MIQHGVYIGDRSELQGKTALLMVSGDIAKAQFDDIGTGYGYGWHTFQRDEWDIEGDADACKQT